MATTEYSRSQLIEFLKALDALLKNEASLTVIGGTAIILGYKINRGTIDIDPWGRVVADIEKNWQEAAQISGVDVRLDTNAGVAQGPDGFEERLALLKDIQFKNLRICYPEAHNLVLMKVMRNVDIDAIDIDALHKKHRLKDKILLNRYLNEVIYIGSQRDLDLKYLATIERLFGEETAERHSQQIAKRR